MKIIEGISILILAKMAHFIEDIRADRSLFLSAPILTLN
jgi:hypothetical protein